MKREKWDRLASVLAAPPTLTEALGGQNAARKSGRRPAMKKNFLKACAVTMAGVMATSGLVFADKMDVSVNIDLNPESIKDALPNFDNTNTGSNNIELPDITGGTGIDPNIFGGDSDDTALIPGGIDLNIPPNINVGDTTDDGSKTAEKTDTNEEGSDSSETTPSDTDSSETTTTAVRKTTSQKKQSVQPEQVSQPEQYEYEEKTVQEAAEVRDASNLTYAQFNQNAITSIDNAESGETVTIKTNLWVSFPKEVLEALKERPDVSVTIDYLYHGVWYTVTIPAGADLDALEDSEGYYGFRYLDQVFGGSLCRVSQ